MIFTTSKLINNFLLLNDNFTNFPKGWFRDRITVSAGLFGMSLAKTCLSLILIITVFFAAIWLLEYWVLESVVGFDLPLGFKIISLISTLFLYTVLINSVNMMYLLMMSCVVFYSTHTLLLGVLIQAYIYQDYTFALRKVDKITNDTDDLLFFLFLGLSIIRLVLALVLWYYVLVLAAIRINGGSGWEKVSALDYEILNIPHQIKGLEEKHIARKRLRSAFEAAGLIPSNKGYIPEIICT
ncbi:hypothetical protein BdWA1_001918 [Babesia duncani]|uniref:Uncharacterized protein n=1 Tax=Babesia duncani TaxID=323732 RepID=A0AAD9PL09_9APIC|nr:hypothetical protein BdWA1_001918 [Babesia duncani]